LDDISGKMAREANAYLVRPRYILDSSKILSMATFSTGTVMDFQDAARHAAENELAQARMT